jgi:3-phenylpropionate/cinnamic acid dioxygenase small subunit
MEGELTRQEAEAFLYKEARLLDERRLEEWLDLFTEDGLYWFPMDEGSDPERDPSILCDDRITRAERVYQLLHQPHHCQMPASRTVHFVSNVEVDGNGNGAESIVWCSVAVFELRPGDERQFGLGQQRSFAARCEYRLRRETEWKIVLKKVMLINRDLPLENLTFVL